MTSSVERERGDKRRYGQGRAAYRSARSLSCTGSTPESTRATVSTRLDATSRFDLDDEDDEHLGAKIATIASMTKRRSEEKWGREEEEEEEEEERERERGREGES